MAGRCFARGTTSRSLGLSLRSGRRDLAAGRPGIGEGPAALSAAQVTAEVRPELGKDSGGSDASSRSRSSTASWSSAPDDLRRRKAQRWEEALANLAELRATGRRLEVSTFGAVLSACGRGLAWEVALFLLQEADAAESSSRRRSLPKCDVVMFNETMSALEKCHQWALTLDLLSHLRESRRSRNLSPNVFSYSSAIRACERGHAWQLGLNLLVQMREDAVDPDVVLYNTSLSLLAKARQWANALEILRRMRADKVRPNVKTFGAAISACARGEKTVKALALLEQMQSSRLGSSVIAVSAAISACERGQRWEDALGLLRGLRRGSAGLSPDIAAYNATISACEKGHRWREALLLLEELLQRPDSGTHGRRPLRPDVITFNSTISACEKASQWSTALTILGRMRARAADEPESAPPEFSTSRLSPRTRDGTVVDPDVVSFNAAISACDRGRQWPSALGLFGELFDAGLQPDVITCNSLISACAAGLAWRPALELLAAMPTMSLTPDQVSYSGAVRSCAGCSWFRALGVLESMLDAAVDPDVSSFSALLMECQQRGLLATEVALLRSLSTTVKREGGERRDGAAGLSDEDTLRSASEAAAAARHSVHGAFAEEVVAQLQLAGDSSPVSAMHAALRKAFGLRDCEPWTGLSLSDTRLAPPLVSVQAHGSGLYAKELALFRHVLATARPGDPQSACAAVEEFGNDCNAGRWLKVAGGDKADVLLYALRLAPLGAGEVLEIGTYCGYSAMLMSAALPEGVRITTLEVDPVHAVLAMNILAFAGLSHRVEVLIGHSEQLLPRIPALRKFGPGKGFCAVFMDQKGSRYDRDLEVLEDHGLLLPGAVIVADNVLKPGAPLFLWRITRDAAFKSQILPVREFAMPAADWMSVSVYQPLAEGRRQELPSPPPELLKLNQASDRMRVQAQASSRSVTYEEWADFAQEMSTRLAELGIQADDGEDLQAYADEVEAWAKRRPMQQQYG
ncbi:unnamed protein product [Polarella glacialis]|uniref:Catechol O-methyltransferase n=1 Tax=Polarella glacialis TaxID=89957 RepID=A0A813GK91_POLGL|nr:unnamed protein product [Polarella glacialis]